LAADSDEEGRGGRVMEGGILGEAGRVNAREDGGCKRKRREGVPGATM